jgi:hypothetical protein
VSFRWKASDWMPGARSIPKLMNDGETGLMFEPGNMRGSERENKKTYLKLSNRDSGMRKIDRRFAEEEFISEKH